MEYTIGLDELLQYAFEGVYIKETELDTLEDIEFTLGQL